MSQGTAQLCWRQWLGQSGPSYGGAIARLCTIGGRKSVGRIRHTRGMGGFRSGMPVEFEASRCRAAAVRCVAGSLLRRVAARPRRPPRWVAALRIPLRRVASAPRTPSLSSRARNARRKDARGQQGARVVSKGMRVVNKGTHVADEGRRMVQNGTHMLQKGTHVVNRAYLYSLDNRPVSYFDRPERASGLSEWPDTVPISYRILASGNTQICSSLIANGLKGAPDVKVYAINGEYDVGFARFLRFIDVIRFVSGSSHFEAPKLLDETISTRSFLDLHMNKYVQLETVELDILSGGDEAMMKEMVEAEASMCTWIGESIDALPSDTNEAAAVVYESSVKGAGPFAGLRFDDKYDAGRDPLGFRWSETLNFAMPTRAEFEETKGGD